MAVPHEIRRRTLLAVLAGACGGASLAALLQATCRRPRAAAPSRPDRIAEIDAASCRYARGMGCTVCVEVCPHQALRAVPGAPPGGPFIRVDSARCTGCGSCLEACPSSAILLVPSKKG